MTGRPIGLVKNAVARFNAGDDDGFVSCFHAECRIYSEPRLTLAEALAGTDALRKWTEDARRRWDELRMTLVDPIEYQGRLVGDILVIAGPDSGGGWRISIAIWFRDDRIYEARLFWHRDDALEALEESA